MKKSLLPPCATVQERAIEATATSRERSDKDKTLGIDQLPLPMGDTWNPDTCPARLLPWLAWALSVDNWDSDWEESIKRAVLRESLMVHRKKGTRGALERALQALGVRITVAEWFETGGEPHTFTLTALANAKVAGEGEVLLDQAFFDTVRRIVEATKPMRSHYTLRVGFNSRTGIKMSAALQGQAVLRERATTEVKPVVRQTIHALGAKARGVSVTRLTLGAI